jgi:hypothetical protein
MMYDADGASAMRRSPRIGISGTRHRKCVARARSRPLGRASLVHAQEIQMIDDRNMRPSDNDAERDRVARDMAGRLFTRGIDVRDDDSNEDVTAMEEAVERFEDLVQAGGGDLMVDEPPRGQKGEPDEARFRLPLRRADEPASKYVARLQRAADDLRSGRPGR